MHHCPRYTPLKWYSNFPDFKSLAFCVPSPLSDPHRFDRALSISTTWVSAAKTYLNFLQRTAASWAEGRQLKIGNVCEWMFQYVQETSLDAEPRLALHRKLRHVIGAIIATIRLRLACLMVHHWRNGWRLGWRPGMFANL
jgi:hypothetical protein